MKTMNLSFEDTVNMLGVSKEQRKEIYLRGIGDPNEKRGRVVTDSLGFIKCYQKYDRVNARYHG